MARVCFYHAGCPDGFGAAWAVWRAWGDDARYLARGHEDPLRAVDHAGDVVAFVDIAPSPRAVQGLSETAAQVILLDHHLSARQRFASVPGLLPALRRAGHVVHFDLERSGAVLAWRHFHPQAEVPAILRYVEDQDLWRWKLPQSREVNATISASPRTFEAWEALEASSPEELASEGIALVRAQEVEVDRVLRHAHPIRVGSHRIEAVNAREHRSLIGHALASRAAYGVPCGAVYRVLGRRVDASLYSVGEFDVAALAGSFGGGGHRNAAGFSVTLEEWLARFA